MLDDAANSGVPHPPLQGLLSESPTLGWGAAYKRRVAGDLEGEKGKEAVFCTGSCSRTHRFAVAPWGTLGDRLVAAASWVRESASAASPWWGSENHLHWCFMCSPIMPGLLKCHGEGIWTLPTRTMVFKFLNVHTIHTKKFRTCYMDIFN